MFFTENKLDGVEYIKGDLMNAIDVTKALYGMASLNVTEPACMASLNPSLLTYETPLVWYLVLLVTMSLWCFLL